MSIGSVIKDRRTALNIKQEDIAKQLNVTVQTVSKWERDLTEPKASQVAEISKILKLSEREICSGAFNEELINPIYFMKKVASTLRLIDEVSFTEKVYEHIDNKGDFLRELEKELINRHGFGIDDITRISEKEYQVAVQETEIENLINRREDL